MGFGPFSSSSEAKEITTVGSDAARLVTGKGAQLTESGSISLGGKGAKFLEPGTLDLSGSKYASINVTQTENSKEALDALKLFGTQFSSGLTGSIQALNAQATERQQSTDELLRGVLSQFGAASERGTAAAQTGGQTELIKPLLWLGLALLGVIGLVLVYRKK